MAASSSSSRGGLLTTAGAEPVTISVVVCSRDGAADLRRCLSALERQTGVSGPLELVVVDDGSKDRTSEVAHAHGATVIRHERSRGLAAARNSGLRASTGPVVAFLDDDCEPAEDWAAHILDAYDAAALGVGGPIEPSHDGGRLGGFIVRNNPLRPLEAELDRSENWVYRLWLYLRRQWQPVPATGRRRTYGLVGANMSFRRSALEAVGGFDEAFSFGADDLELCRRVAAALPDGHLIFDERPRVAHHFKATLRDVLRRSRGYGLGSARLYRHRGRPKPTLFPLPIVLAVVLAAARRRPVLWALAVLLPQLWSPRAAVHAVRHRDASALTDPYVQVLQETAGDAGVLEGLWRFRDGRGSSA
ncbi:MAG TPA: glycosyltransferase [Solirubrobacteraceae bacterium]|nr:glycosyltransferase [Solirubrobacteraceae bacterium]